MKVRRREHDHELNELVAVGESAIHGRGLFATRRIARDEYIGTFCGPPAKRDGMHVLWVYEGDDEDAMAVGRIGRNLLRFLNHDARCNAVFDGFDLYAVRAIRSGEEITIDYGTGW
ncbi:MAG: SET domain-containing protein [Gammaproteobacteria bacterium]|nr:SET domain-containing protein [Gammaproteobacteria bacterium]